MAGYWSSVDTAPIAVSAVRLDGKAIPLDCLTEVEVSATLASPARSLRCTAAVGAFPGEVGEVTAAHDGRALFTGRLDKQTEAISAAGRTVTLEARSKGALLLDNEAAPCVLENVSAATVFEIFIAPYGFALYGPHGNSPRLNRADHRLAQYAVPKGTSEWEALTGFTRRVYGRTPFVRGDEVLLTRPEGAIPLVIGGAGLAYTRLERVYCPYRILSKVVLRDPDGVYSTAVHNSAAEYYGVRRKRYVVPANEFVDVGGLDANQRIRASMLRRERVDVTLPGVVWASLGQEARIAGGEAPSANWMVEEVAWRQNQNGLTTTLGLVNPFYYD